MFGVRLGVVPATARDDGGLLRRSQDGTVDEVEVKQDSAGILETSCFRSEGFFRCRAAISCCSAAMPSASASSGSSAMSLRLFGASSSSPALSSPASSSSSSFSSASLSSSEVKTRFSSAYHRRRDDLDRLADVQREAHPDELRNRPHLRLPAAQHRDEEVSTACASASSGLVSSVEIACVARAAGDRLSFLFKVHVFSGIHAAEPP